jgi:hypothetical protein
MSLRAGTTAAVAALVLAIGPTAAQAADLPVGETGGVRVRSDHGNVAVVFTARAARRYRRIAGRVALVACTDLPASHLLGGEGRGDQGRGVARPEAPVDAPD